MPRWKPRVAGVAVLGLAMAGFALGSASGQSATRPASGPGSCTLKGSPDDYECTGAVFAKPGVEFSKFPQPKNFAIAHKTATHPEQPGVTDHSQPAPAVNPLAPYFPPFQHIVVIYRANHTFDDYLGDCATTIAAGCNGQVQSTNHIGSVPNLHDLAKTYALDDAYSTGVQPPPGPNDWLLFSGQSSSSSQQQQQSYPAAAGAQFDRFLSGGNGPTDEGTNACTPLTDTGSGSSPYKFVTNGGFYWMLNSGRGYWKNPADGNLEALPPNRPGTTVPEELHYNAYSCLNQSIPDSTVADDYINFVNTNGLPAYNYVELFNDHPGTYQDIPGNDSATNSVVDAIMGNPSYKDNTLIVVTEGDTQNGDNGPDHVSNTYRVPLLVIGSPTYVKQHYLSHVAYTTSNVLAATERTMENVRSGLIDPNDNPGLAAFPMTGADQAALGDPLEDFWVQGSRPLPASATASPIAVTAPDAPTGLAATLGADQVALSWTPPAGDGGANLTAYKVYRGTASGVETLLTGGGCSGLGVVTSCTDTGLTAGQTYYYKVTASNPIGDGPQSTEASATPSGSGCQAQQLLGNPGFENGSSNPAPWLVSSTHTPLSVISNSSSEPHGGSWYAWLDGWGKTTTDTVSQKVTLPTGCTSYDFSFWLHINTAETTTSAAYDTLKVQVLNSSGTVLSTLATYSNLNHGTGLTQHTFSLKAYAGQQVTLKFLGVEDYTLQTSFVVDDTALNVS